MTRPMRILRVACIPGHRAGGMARYIHMVSDILLAQGHQVSHIFAPDIHRDAKSRGYLDRFLTTYRAAKAVQRVLDEGRSFDVVDIHEPIAAYYAWKRSRNRKLPPLLVSVYGLEARSHLARIEYLRKKNLKVDLKTRWSPLSVVWQANYALRHADHITVETSEDVDYLTGTMRIPLARITQQLGGVTEPYFERIETKRSGILFVGTWIDRKGVPELIAAFTKIARERTDTTLTIAGAGTSNENVLNSFPEDVRVRIRFSPATDNDRDLAHIYRSHAVFVLPTTYEGLPLVLIEAAAAGLPIVTTPICGMRDMIRHEINGLLIPTADAEALAVSIERLLDEPETCRLLGEAAENTARDYTWQRSADAYLRACRAAAES